MRLGLILVVAVVLSVPAACLADQAIAMPINTDRAVDVGVQGAREGKWLWIDRGIKRLRRRAIELRAWCPGRALVGHPANAKIVPILLHLDLSVVTLVGDHRKDIAIPDLADRL